MTRKRFRKADWLDHGLAQLSKGGPEALKLDAICASAGLTKGSFYHHFPDHTAFLTAVAQHWVETQTQALIDAIPPDAPSAEKAARLTELASAIDYQAELGIRELARRTPAVARLVSGADSRRRQFLTGLYAETYNLFDADAAFAADIEYATYLGMMLLHPDMDRSAQHQLAERMDAMFGAYLGRL